MTATQGGADQEGEAVALSGKELGDEERRTPRGSEIWSLRKEFKDPVKGEAEGQSQAKEDGELLGRFLNRSQDSDESRFARTGWKLRPGEEE